MNLISFHSNALFDCEFTVLIVSFMCYFISILLARMYLPLNPTHTSVYIHCYSSTEMKSKQHTYYIF